MHDARPCIVIVSRVKRHRVVDGDALVAAMRSSMRADDALGAAAERDHVADLPVGDGEAVDAEVFATDVEEAENGKASPPYVRWDTNMPTITFRSLRARGCPRPTVRS